MTEQEREQGRGIPIRYIEFCKAVGRLAREYKLTDLNASFRPGVFEDWYETVEMSWASGRHYDGANRVTITSSKRIVTTVDTESTNEVNHAN